MKVQKELILEYTKDIDLPLKGESSHISLSSIKEIQLEQNTLTVHFTLPIPNLNLRKKTAEVLIQCLKQKFPSHEVKVYISIGKIPPAPGKKKRPAGLEEVKNIIAIASGKGGVGKSTLTCNLGVSLSKMGFKVGIVDADIFGPSIPIMLDTVKSKPLATTKGDSRMMVPIENHGVKMLSMGFFAGENEAMVWRGPMASKALQQILYDGDWKDLDFMLVDLPPGTSDIHLSLVQMVPVTGALMVSTPQSLALADLKKGVGMFNMTSINVPVLGIIENMSYFCPPESPKQKHYLFGKDGVKKFAAEYKVPFLGEIPIDQSIRAGSDAGTPISLEESHTSAQTYKEISQKLIAEVLKRNKELPATEIVRISNMSGCSSVVRKA